LKKTFSKCCRHLRLNHEQLNFTNMWFLSFSFGDHQIGLLGQKWYFARMECRLFAVKLPSTACNDVCVSLAIHIFADVWCRYPFLLPRLVRQKRKTFNKPSSAALLRAFSVSVTLVACVSERKPVV